MRTTTDVLRSLAKYTAENVLDPAAWETRLAVEEGTFIRPFCRVGVAGPTQYPAASFHHKDAIQPCTLHLFPVEQSNPEAAMLAALAVEDLIFQGFEVGRGLGRSRRVPLWDFDGVDLDHTSDVRFYCDYMRVNDFSVGRSVDPENEKNIVVTADIRVTWRRRADMTPAPYIHRDPPPPPVFDVSVEIDVGP